MANNQDRQEYQDYQDYQDYQKYQASQRPNYSETKGIGPLAPPQAKDISFSDSAALSFASTPEEKKAYLNKEHPGISYDKQPMQFKGETAPAPMSGHDLSVTGTDAYGFRRNPDLSLVQEDVARIPGESVPSRLKSRDLGAGLLGEQAGMLPTAAAGGVAGLVGLTGNVPASAAVFGAGEAGRKEIGHRLLGIPRLQTPGQYATDVAVQAGVGGLLQAGGNILSGAARPAISTAAEELPSTFESGNQPIGRGQQREIEIPQSYMEEPIAIPDPGQKPTTPEQISEMVKRSGVHPEDIVAPPKDMPTLDAVNDALSKTSKWNYPPTEIHAEMLSNSGARDIGGTLKSLPGKAADEFNVYNYNMKQEGQQKIKTAIESLGDGIKKNPDKLDAGQNVVQKFAGLYKNNNDMLSKGFEEIFKNPPPAGVGLDSLAEKISEEIPTLKGRVSIDESGSLSMAPWNRASGIDKGVYNEISDTLKEISSPKTTFRGLQNIRGYLRTQTDPSNPKKYLPLNDVRKVVLDHMAEQADIHVAGSKYRELVTNYAKNEGWLNQIEDILGGKLDNPDALANAVPEKALDNIFKNSNTAAVAKNVLGEKEFQNVMGDYLAGKMESHMDAGNLKTGAFYRELLKKSPVLRGNLPEATANELYEVPNIMRLVPDMAPVNPAGTAKTTQIGGLLGRVKGLLDPLEEGLPIKPSKSIEGIHEALKKPAVEKKATNRLRGLLKGEP